MPPAALPARILRNGKSGKRGNRELKAPTEAALPLLANRTGGEVANPAASASPSLNCRYRSGIGFRPVRQESIFTLVCIAPCKRQPPWRRHPCSWCTDRQPSLRILVLVRCNSLPGQLWLRQRVFPQLQRIGKYQNQTCATPWTIASSPLLVRVEDVVLRLHGHMARVPAIGGAGRP